MKQPDLTLAPPAPVDEIVPVIFEPPAQQEVVLPETPEEDVDSTAENIETPQVVTIVAADPSAASFAVPVQGPVAFAPARLAAPPPLNPPKPRAMPKGPVLFTQVGEASTPGPNRYPPEAQRRGEQGTVWVEFKVQTNGVPFEVVVTESSRSDALDKWAVDWIQSRWSFPPGEQRHFKVSFVFQLRK